MAGLSPTPMGQAHPLAWVLVLHTALYRLCTLLHMLIMHTAPCARFMHAHSCVGVYTHCPVCVVYSHCPVCKCCLCILTWVKFCLNCPVCKCSLCTPPGVQAFIMHTTLCASVCYAHCPVCKSVQSTLPYVQVFAKHTCPMCICNTHCSVFIMHTSPCAHGFFLSTLPPM